MAEGVIDTDVASRLQKGSEPAWVRDHVLGARTWLTFVIIGELSEWGHLRNSGDTIPSSSA